MNEKLRSIYQDVNKEIHNLVKEKDSQFKEHTEKATYPLFLKSNADYENADVKLLIFGKETNGWGGKGGKYGENNNITVEAILDEYDRFFTSKSCYNYGGQFWNGVKAFITKLRSSNQNIKIEYLWNNIVKIGLDKKGFPELLYDSILKSYLQELILKEIYILKPDYIIFFSGPNSSNGPYDSILDSIFNNPLREKIDGFTERALCKILIPNTKKAFRTYHPNFLYRNNKKRPINDFFNKIVSEINL